MFKNWNVFDTLSVIFAGFLIHLCFLKPEILASQATQLWFGGFGDYMIMLTVSGCSSILYDKLKEISGKD